MTDILYHEKLVALLEEVWGAGFLSPGGRDEISRMVGDVDFRGKTVLDIGCGTGGADIALVRDHGAAYITGVDVEDGVLAAARKCILTAGCDQHIGLLKVVAGSLPFPPQSFDIVFSKDSIVHIPNKNALMREVVRVLRPGGWFVASDWMIGHDGPMSDDMREYVTAEGLDFGMGSPAVYKLAMEQAGFFQIDLVNRNDWYHIVAKNELARMKGPWRHRVAETLGEEFVTHNIGIWEKMITVLASGEHCPTHIRGQCPK
ncbi:MAG: methyltransferase domain-containing protein [Paracoccaceae bacterium]